MNNKNKRDSKEKKFKIETIIILIINMFFILLLFNNLNLNNNVTNYNFVAATQGQQCDSTIGNEDCDNGEWCCNAGRTTCYQNVQASATCETDPDAYQNVCESVYRCAASGTAANACDSGTYTDPTFEWIAGTINDCCGDDTNEDFASGSNNIAFCCDGTETADDSYCGSSGGWVYDWQVDGSQCTGVVYDGGSTSGTTISGDDVVCACDASGADSTAPNICDSTDSGAAADGVCVDNDGDGGGTTFSCDTGEVCDDGTYFADDCGDCASEAVCDSNVNSGGTTPTYIADGMCGGSGDTTVDDCLTGTTCRNSESSNVLQSDCSCASAITDWDPYDSSAGTTFSGDGICISSTADTTGEACLTGGNYYTDCSNTNCNSRDGTVIACDDITDADYTTSGICGEADADDTDDDCLTGAACKASEDTDSIQQNCECNVDSTDWDPYDSSVSNGAFSADGICVGTTADTTGESCFDGTNYQTDCSSCNDGNACDSDITDGAYSADGQCDKSAGVCDTVAPYWNGNVTNFTSIKVNENGQFMINYTDETALDTIIFSIRNHTSLSWVNLTTQRVTGTDYNVTFNLTMSSRKNETFQWKFYANDTAGQWNETDVFSTVITNTAPLITTALINSTNPARNNTDQNLTAHPSGASDADNDNITYAYRWYNTTGRVAETVHFDNKSLVAYYPFDYDARDYTGGNDGVLNDGAFINNTDFKQGVGSASFDGDNDYIDIDGLLTNDLVSTTKGTLAAWIKPTAIGSTSMIYGVGDANADTYIIAYLKPTGVMEFSISNAGSVKWRILTDNVEVAVDVWAHVALVQRADGTAPTIYIDSVEVLQTQDISSPSLNYWFNDIPALDTLRLGSLNYNGGGEQFYFKGKIDSVAIWNRSLSADEIRKLYDAQAGNFLNSSLTVENENYLVQITPIDFDDWGTPLNSSWINIADTHATWNQNGTNATLYYVNDNVMFNITFTDSDNLDSAIFSLKNSTGADWYNYSALRISGRSYDLKYNITLSSNHIQTLSWRYYVNDSYGTMYNSSIFNIVISDTAGTWSKNGTNATIYYVNDNVMFNVTVTDPDGLASYIFSLKNSTGADWYNFSAVSILGNTSYPANTSISLSSVSGNTLSWRYYFNDSAGTMYNSSVFDITISNTAPTAPTSINWITLGDLTDNTLIYRQTLDTINATCNNENDLDLIGCNITVIRPDSSIEVGNQPMSQSNNLYNYSDNIKLTASGTWTIQVTAYDSEDQTTSTATITVSITTPTIVDGLYGYDTEKLIYEDDILNDYNYGYDTMGYKLNWSDMDDNWTDMKFIINQTYDIINAKSFLRFYFNGSYDPTNVYTNTTCNEVHTYLTDLRNDPHDEEVLFFVIELNQSQGYEVNFTNKISECMVNATNNRYPVYVFNYSNSSLDTDYVSNWTMIRYTARSNQTLLDNELKYLRTDTSLTRIYYNLSAKIKAKAQDFHDKIITDLRDNIRITSFTNVKLAETVNGDLIVINNESSEKLINATNITERDGKDIWDIVNDRLIEKNTDGNFTLNLSSLSYTILFFDDLDHLTTSHVYKASVPEEKERQYNTSSNAAGTWIITGNNDVKSIIWDTSYDHSNHFMIHYEWINSSTITNYSDYCDNGNGVVIIADKNDIEINGSINCNNASYGYISVAGYENTDAWENSKKIEIDQWVDNYKINVFIDGLDYGASESGFETRMKSLGDYIREEKDKKAIFNDYTSYKTVSEYGDMDMKESFCGRWSGEVNDPTYTWEIFSVDLDRAKWAKTNNKKQLLMTFGEENNVSKISYCYAMYLVFFGPTNLWKYAQPNFQNQREQFTINAGNVLQNSWTEVNSTYYTRRYSNGIVWIDIDNHNWGINNGRKINKIEVHLRLQHYAADPSAASGLNVSINDGDPSVIAPLDICATQWCEKTVVINITNDFTDNGRYLIRVYPNDRNNANGINLYNQDANGTGVYSWYDSSANNYPLAEPSWAAYGRSGNQLDTVTKNWIISLLINDSTSASIDDLTGINQYNKTENKITNITLNSTESYNMSVWGDFFAVPLSQNKYTFKYLNTSNWVTISPLWTSDCNSTEPTWSTTTIDNLDHKSCYYTDGFRFVTPKLSEQIYSMESNYATWSKNGTNFTELRVNDNAMFNITVSDADGLDRCIFSLKNDTGAPWENYSALDISGTSYELKYNITIKNSTRSDILSWRYYCNDTEGVMYNSSINSIVITDTNPVWTTNINDDTLNEDDPETNHDDISGYCTDADSDSITYNIQTEDTSQVDVTLTGTQLSHTPVANWNGTSTATIRCTANSATTDDNYDIVVNAINDDMLWSNNATNATTVKVNDNIMATVNVTDNDTIAMCLFSLKNSTGADWYNYSALNVNALVYNATYNFTVSSNHTQTLSWRFYCNDTEGVMYNSTINNILISDTYATWSRNGTNFTELRVNDNAMFNITVSDADGLDRCIFSLKNDTGAPWENYSALDISGTSYELKYNITIKNSTRSDILSWRYYCNSSSGTMYNSSVYNITITNTAPPTPSFTSPTPPNGNFTNQNQTLNWTSNDNDGDEFYYWLNITMPSGSLMTPLINSQENNWTTNFTDGIYYYYVLAGDTYDNSSWTTVRNITIDTVNPTTGLTAPMNGTWINTSAITFKYTSTDTNLDTCILYNDESGTFKANITNRTNDGMSSGTQIEALINLIDSNNMLWNIWCNDSAGNEAFNTTNYTLKIDATIPENVYITPTKPNNTYINNDYIFAAVSVTETNEANITFSVWGQATSSTTYTIAERTIFWESLSDGTYYYNVSVSDYAHNINTTEIRVIHLDHTAPVVSLNKYKDQLHKKEMNTTFGAICTENNKTSNSTLYGNWTGTWNENETIGYTSETSFNFTSFNLTDGNYLWNVWCNDSAGNSAFNSTNYTLTIDTISPAINLTSLTENNNTFFARDYIFIKVSASDINFANITYYLWNDTDNLIVNKTTFSSLTTSFNITGLVNTDEPYWYNVTISDIAKNTNTTEIRKITLDGSSPIISLDSPNNNSWNNIRRVVFGFTPIDSNLDDCTIHHDASGTFVANKTNRAVLTGQQASIQVYIQDMTNITWNVFCNDSTGNEAFNTTFNLTVKVNTELPNYTKFQYGKTTDIWNTSYQNLDNLVLETINGSISWINTVNTTSLDLDNYINLSFNYIFVNATKLHSSLNSSANITFYSLPFTDPIILKDNVEKCPDYICKEISYDSSTGNLTFNVTHFSSYSATENVNLTTFDSTDPENNFATIDVNMQAIFYANYTFANGTSFNTTKAGYCNISYNNTGSWETFGGFTYNSSSERYEFNRSFNAPGTYFYNISCNASNIDAYYLSILDNITIIGINLEGNLSKYNVSEFANVTVFGFISLSNGTNLTNTNISIYYRGSPQYYNDTSGMLENASAPNNTKTNNTAGFSYIIGAPGFEYSHIVVVNLTYGVLKGNYNTSFKVTIDYPEVALVLPLNNTWYYTNDIFFEYVPKDVSIFYCTLYHNETGTFKPNVTNLSLTNLKPVNLTINLADSENIMWNVECVDRAINAEFNNTNYTLKINANPPTITLNSPINGSVITAGTVIDLSITDNNLDEVWYSNKSGNINATLTSSYDIPTIGFNDGTINITVWANDTAFNTTRVNLRYIIDNTLPVVILNIPFNNTITTNNYTIFGVNCTDVNPANITLFGNWSGTWQGNETINYTSKLDINFTEINLTDGNYIWNVYCNDTAGNNDTFNFNYTLDIDVSKPTITAAPGTNSHIIVGSSINLTITDDHLSRVWYTKDSGLTNTSLISPYQISTTGWSTEATNVIVWANDTFNNTVSEIFTYTTYTVNITIFLSKNPVVRNESLYVYGKINLTNGTNVSNHNILLWVNNTLQTKSQVINTYDFSDLSNKKAYEKGSSVPVSLGDYDVEATSGNYTNIGTSDDSKWVTASASGGQFDSQVYLINITEDIDYIISLNISWEGYGDTNPGFYTNLSIWNWSLGDWIEYDNKDFTTATDANLKASINSNLSDFINSSTKQIAILVTTEKALANGGSCSGDGSECGSGNCVDDVCCDTSCSGTCQACDISGSEGTCTALTGQDPDNECGTSGCGTGLCTASSSCGYYTSGERNCDACQTCVDATSGSCVNIADGSHDSEGSQTCSQACEFCDGAGTCENIVGEGDCATCTTCAGSSATCSNIADDTQDSEGSNLCLSTNYYCNSATCQYLTWRYTGNSWANDLAAPSPQNRCTLAVKNVLGYGNNWYGNPASKDHLLGTYHNPGGTFTTYEYLCSYPSPFIYIFNGIDYEFKSDFIATATSKDKEYVSITDVSDTILINNSVKLKMTEELDETTYLDNYYLRIYDYIDENDFDNYFNENFEKINYNNWNQTSPYKPYSIIEHNIIAVNQSTLTLNSDDKYLIMEKGFEKEIQFVVPDLPIGYSRKIFFVAEGYYIEHSVEKQNHQSLYTDYIKVEIGYRGTNANGEYNFSIIAPSQEGDYEVMVNLTYNTDFYANITLTVAELPGITLNTPSNNVWQSYPNVLFGYTATDGNLNTCILYHNASGSWQANVTNRTSIGLVSGTQASISLNLTDTNFTGVIWNVWCNDTTGNANWSLSNYTIKIDLDTPPTPTTIIDNASDNADGNFDIDWNDTIDTGSGTTYYLYESIDNGASYTSLGTSSVSYYSLTGKSNNNYTYIVSAKNGVGTFGSNSSISDGIYVDTTLPTISFTNPTKDTDTYINNDYVFAGVSVTETNEANITFNLWNTTTLNTTNYTTAKRTINWTNLADGTYSYNVSVEDYAHNKATTEIRTIHLDHIAPNVSLNNPLNNTYSNNANTTFGAVCTENNKTANSVLYGNWTGTWNENETIGYTSGTSFNFTSFNLTDGNYLWNVYCNDSAGNSAFNSTNYTLTIDTISPAINLTSLTENNNTFFARDYIFIKVSASDINFANITYYLWNDTDNLIVNKTTFSSLTTSFNITGLVNTDEPYWYNVTISDIAKNTNTTEIRKITLDTVPPLVGLSLDEPGNDTWNNIRRVVFKFTPYDKNLESCTIHHDASGTFVANKTNRAVLTGQQASIQVYMQDMTNISWNVFCNDSTGNEAFNTTFNLTVKLNSQLPNYTKFQYGKTTDIWNTSYQNLDNLVLETVNGLLSWINAVNTTSMDLDNYINLSFNYIFVNATKLHSSLNSSANITFYSLPFTDPIILKDNVEKCPDYICKEISYDSSTGNLTFNVTHFSSYSATENVNLTTFDSTDPENNFATIDVNMQAIFYANYTFANGTSFNTTKSGYCNISYNNTGSWETFGGFTYNSSSERYELNRSFNAPGTYFYNISCNATNIDAYYLSVLDNITIIGMNIEAGLNQSSVGELEGIALYGFINLSNGTIVNNTNFSIYIDAVPQSYNQTSNVLENNSVINNTITNSTAQYRYNIKTRAFEGTYVIIINLTHGVLTASKTISFSVTEVPPEVALVLPLNDTWYYSNDIFFEYVPKDTTITSCTLYHNDTGTFEANVTNSSLTNLKPVNLTINLADSENIIWNVKCNDAAGNSVFNDTNYTLKINANPPTITLNSPSNESVIKNGTIIDLSITDTNLNASWWSNNSGIVNYTLNNPFDISTTGWQNGSVNITVWANDTAANITKEYYEFTIDDNLPIVNLTYPSNTSTFKNRTTFFTAICNDDNSENVTLYGNWTGTWQANETVFYFTQTQFNFTSFNQTDGNYIWNVHCNDSAGNENFAQINNTFTIDSLTPFIILNDPLNASHIPTTHSINFSVIENNTDEVWYSNNNGITNSTITIQNGYYIINPAGWAFEKTNLTIWVNDTVGWENSSIFEFTFSSMNITKNESRTKVITGALVYVFGHVNLSNGTNVTWTPMYLWINRTIWDIRIDTINDFNQTQWDLGNYSNTNTTTQNNLSLIGTNLIGNYTSKVYDVRGNEKGVARWVSLSVEMAPGYNASISWWDSTWLYRRRIEVAEIGNIALTKYPVNISINTATLISSENMQSDCGEIRIIEDNTERPWINISCNTVSTSIWFNVSSLSALETKVLYLYYGNSNAVNANYTDVDLFGPDLSSSQTLTSVQQNFPCKSIAPGGVTTNFASGTGCGLCSQCDGSGNCNSIASGSDPNDECTGTGTCGGTCNGAGGCQYPSTETDAGTCTTCNGAGATAYVTVDTDPFGECGTSPCAGVCDGTGSCYNYAAEDSYAGSCKECDGSGSFNYPTNDPWNDCQYGDCDGSGSCADVGGTIFTVSPYTFAISPVVGSGTYNQANSGCNSYRDPEAWQLCLNFHTLYGINSDEHTNDPFRGGCEATAWIPSDEWIGAGRGGSSSLSPVWGKCYPLSVIGSSGVYTENDILQYRCCKQIS